MVADRETHVRADFLGLDVLKTPVWVFDLDRASHWWINLAGVALWGAPSREELLHPDRVMQQSEATRTRLALYRRRFERDEVVRERWTIYPDGRSPVVIESECSGVMIDDQDGRPARMAMLVEAREVPPADVDPLERRSVEALRHVGEPVSLYTPAGAVLLRNPAALRAFGEAVPGESRDALTATFVDPADAAASRAALDGQVRRFDARLRTAAGEQVHNLEVRATPDPVTGEPALLICSRDLGERLAYEAALEHSRTLLAAQADELARLAAPVLRVWPQILVLPLIGRVDRERMAVALAALTPRIAGEQARAVIFDLTGAVFVDLETAESLQRAVRVLGLLGCSAVIAGVLPGLAALLVAGDVRLDAPIHQTISDALRSLIRAP